MKIIAIIPARWASTRFPGKVLADINGRPMLQHVYERVAQVSLLDDILIACDCENVMRVAQQFGAKTVMTSDKHPSGSDRIAEVVQNIEADIVINVQGDEPLIDPSVIDALISVLKQESECVMATVIKRIDNEDDLNNSNVVKVVIDNNDYALYFSRSLVPFNRDNEDVTYYRHLGIYAYRKNFLLKYVTLPQSNLERIEKLEQLRVLENGYKIKTIKTNMETIGVDTIEDLKKVLERLS